MIIKTKIIKSWLTKRRESKTEPIFKGQTKERKSVKRLRRKDQRSGR